MWREGLRVWVRRLGVAILMGVGGEIVGLVVEVLVEEEEGEGRRKEVVALVSGES